MMSEQPNTLDDLLSLLSYSALGEALTDLIELDEEWQDDKISALKGAIIEARKEKLMKGFEVGNGKIIPVANWSEEITNLVEAGKIEQACQLVAYYQVKFPDTNYRDWEPLNERQQAMADEALQGLKREKASNPPPFLSIQE